MKLFPCVVSLALLSGCETQGPSAQAPPPNPGTQCYGALGGYATLAPLAGKLVLTGTGGTTLPMQADTNKPSAAEKEALVQWAVLREQCAQLTKRWQRDSNAPPWFVSISNQITDTADALVSALYRGELTYGEFNVKRLAASADGRKRMADAREISRREYDAARQQEALARIMAAPPPAPIVNVAPVQPLPMRVSPRQNVQPATAVPNANWTGRQEPVQTVTGLSAWRCEYEVNGQRFFRVFENVCPSAIAVQ